MHKSTYMCNAMHCNVIKLTKFIFRLNIKKNAFSFGVKKITKIPGKSEK